MSAETQCRFEKALISGTAECTQVKRLEIGERLVCLCQSPAAAEQCSQYFFLLKKNARFLFRQTDARDSLLSNYQEIQLQCGGLQGLAEAVYGEQADKNFDVYTLLQMLENKYQGIESIRMDRIVPRIAGYNPRPHRKKR